MKTVVVALSLLVLVSCAETKFTGASSKSPSSNNAAPGKTDGETGVEKPKTEEPNLGSEKPTDSNKGNGGGDIPKTEEPKKEEPKKEEPKKEEPKKDEPKKETDGPTKGQTLPVVKVGVNFEDLPGQQGNDNDYNDAVLCFEGNFDMTDTLLVSQKDQTVKATAFSESSCRHNVEVTIIHADGSKEPTIVYDSHSKTEVPLAFRKGDKLEVNMLVTEGICKKERYNMHDRNAAKAKPNLCNNR